MSERKKYPFPQGKPDDPSFTHLLSWWRQLEQDKGERATLRRAASLTEVMLNPAYIRLLRELRNAKFAISNHDQPLSKVAAIAGLVARIKEEPNPNEGLAKRMGSPKPGSTAATVSELRLRRLLACDDLEELYTLLRRLLAQLDDRANLADLAAIVWNWSPLDDKWPYDPRRQLAYDYYEAAPIKP